MIHWPIKKIKPTPKLYIFTSCSSPKMEKFMMHLRISWMDIGSYYCFYALATISLFIKQYLPLINQSSEFSNNILYDMTYEIILIEFLENNIKRLNSRPKYCLQLYFPRWICLSLVLPHRGNTWGGRYPSVMLLTYGAIVMFHLVPAPCSSHSQLLSVFLKISML